MSATDVTYRRIRNDRMMNVESEGYRIKRSVYCKIHRGIFSWRGWGMTNGNLRQPGTMQVISCRD